ncbi:MAG TPA: hypothetical protein VFX65_09015 [Candidatus Limnocylindrales bacterium]|nr:hypothetical protein [Candidatus Limnocylindrales bacterium]
MANADTAHDAQPLPDTREGLLALHREARRRRDGAPLDSEERAAATEEIARIEVHIARIERAMDPPLV